MREISYSQDLVINDPKLLATLCVFCEKVYLPYPGVARDIHTAATMSNTDELVQSIERQWENDPEKNLSYDWRDQHQLLFTNGIIEFLPVHRHVEHRHRHLDDTEEARTQLYGDTRKRGITSNLALNHHTIRDDLPGIDFFDGSLNAGAIELPKEFFSLGLPTLSGNDEQICELRDVAQQKGIKEFWEMVDEQVRLADAKKESYITRAETIRKDFDKWAADFWKFRGAGLGVLALTALCFVNSTVTPFATIAACSWLGEVNQRWAQRKTLTHQAFKFINRFRGTLLR
jgi:hypothetical protein